MGETVHLLRAWRATLADLGADLGGSVLLGAPGGDVLAEAMGAPIRQGGPSLVTLGAGHTPDLVAGGLPEATGLPADSFDAAVMLAAWDGPAQLAAVAIEAARVVRPGGTVRLGDLDVATLTTAQPAASPAAVAYRSYPQVAAAAAVGRESTAGLGLAVLRAGLRPIVADAMELPAYSIADPSEYLEMIRSRVLPGLDRLVSADLDAVLTEVRSRLNGKRFPMIVTVPWLLVHGFVTR